MERPRVIRRIDRIPRQPAIFLLLLCAALLPRIFTLDRPLTVDEAYFWQNRSATFLNAVTSGHFADTMITGHPGVTTMWLGSVGLLLERALRALGLLAAPSAPHHLALLRLPLACANALAIPVGYLLLRRVLGSAVAIVAALLWASDPFLVAHSRLIHVDAVLTTATLLSTLALLAACFGCAGPNDRPRVRLLVVAGVAGGLALLTKAPGVLVFPIGAVVLAVWYWLSRSSAPTLFGAAAIWGGMALLTAFVGWPALWVAPARAISSVINEVIANGGTEHPHNFLLGSPDKDPGALFYPVTLLGRTTPWSALGLLGLALAVWRRWPWLRARRAPLLLLAFAALLIVLVLAIIPKKFDRYALPAVPLFLALSACGLVWIGARLPTLPRRVAGLLVAAAAVVTLLILHPYYLAYYSPLIGGSAYAPEIVPIGWGEGLDLAAEWLNAQPDTAGGVVATWSPPSIQPYLRATATWQDLVTTNKVDYLVVYIYQTQTGGLYFGKYRDECTPLHTVRLYGMDYVWIYGVSRQVSRPIDGRFGDAVALKGYSLTPPNTACTNAPLALALSVQPLAAADQPAMFFIHIIGPDGQRPAQFDFPLNTLIPPRQGQAGGDLSHAFQLPFPTNVPPGTYRIYFGVYDPATGKRLPFQTSAPQPVELDGPDAMQIASFDVRAIPQAR